MLLHLVPWYHKSGPMSTKDGACRIFQIPLRIVSNVLDHLFRVVAGQISFQAARQSSPALRIGGQLGLIIPHIHNRNRALQDCRVPVLLRRAEGSMHPLEIRQGTSHRILRHLQPVFVIGLQQNALRFFQSLPHRPVSGLTEIPALRLLQMGPSGRQCDPQIRDGRTGQHARMLLFFQMGQDQPLPVPIQHILAADRCELQAAPRLSRFQQQMNLRIVPQRFKMSHAFHRIRDCFFVYNVSRPKFHLHMEPFQDQALQDLNLHFPHKLDMDLSQRFIPYDMQQRLLFLQLPEVFQHHMNVTVRRELDLVGQNRLQNGHSRLRLDP